MNDRILIADDEQEIADLIEVYLQNEGFRVLKFYDAQEALSCIEKEPVDLAVLDIMMPGISGLTLCRKIREKYHYPIIMLTAKGEEMDKINGLALGADDYMTKPFDLNVLTAKVAALVRRTYDYQSDGQQGITFGKAFLNTAEAVLYINNQRVDLTKNEFRILKLLLEHKNRLVSRDELMQALWESENFIDDNTLTVNVARLRRKLEQNGLSRCIETKKGLGYILNA